MGKGNKRVNYNIGNDQKKAGKCIMIGITIAIIFGSVTLVSNSLDAGAIDWYDYEEAIVSELQSEGTITLEEADIRRDALEDTRDWMLIQDFYIGLIAPVAINIGLIFVIIGFVGFAINDSLDERTRRAAVLIAAVIIFFILILQSYTMNITIA